MSGHRKWSEVRDNRHQRREAAATTATAPVDAPKHVLVRGKKIRLRWVQQIAWSILVANAGALIISALYYIFVQVKWPGATYGGHTHTILYLKPDWDHLFGWKQWPTDRHTIRNVYEAALATLFVGSVLADWRKHTRLAPAWYVAISPLVIIVAAAPLVVGGVYLLDHVLPSTSPPGWLARVLNDLVGIPWQPVVIGVVVGQVVKRLYAPAGNTVNWYFTARAVDKARDARRDGDPDPERFLPHWPVPPNIRERAAWTYEADLPCPDRGHNIKAAVYAVTVIMLGLIGWGIYVRYVIAKR